MRIQEGHARRIFQTAIIHNRSAELLEALLNGGSATLTQSGKLIIIRAQPLPGMDNVL